ncbi:hypothetical protein N665_0778s0018 [Sinapis alba]|nr:hypothetical protein N665_0778s0018 [Sinapis alba]
MGRLWDTRQAFNSLPLFHLYLSSIVKSDGFKSKTFNSPPLFHLLSLSDHEIRRFQIKNVVIDLFSSDESVGDSGSRSSPLFDDESIGMKERGEIEKKGRDLERKVVFLEVRLMEERSKKVRAEEEMREKGNQKEEEIKELKRKVSDF